MKSALRGEQKEILHPGLSEEIIRQQIPRFKWFIDVDFGNGIRAQSTVWPDAPANSPHVGVDKFEFIVRRNLPSLAGARILELGCNCGVIDFPIRTSMRRGTSRSAASFRRNTTARLWLAASEAEPVAPLIHGRPSPVGAGVPASLDGLADAFNTSNQASVNIRSKTALA